MEKISFEVPEISCNHCKKSITNILKQIGIKKVKVDIKSKKVFLEYDKNKISIDTIKESLTEIGYSVTNLYE